MGEQHKLPKKSKGYNNLCDMWAAGVTMYMLVLGGRHPFLNASNHFDKEKLLQGVLDFSSPHFFGFGMERYSEPARQLCRRLVEPDMARRIPASIALLHPWLSQSGKSNSSGVEGANIAETHFP